MAKKNKTVYRCSSCGYETAKWLGRCPNCGLWNTMNEEVLSQQPSGISTAASRRTTPLSVSSLSDIPVEESRRFSTGSPEFDLLLGGGMVPGGVILLGGEPGIGKSTLLLQTAGKSAALLNSNVLYVCAEESLSQVKMRAERLKINEQKLLLTTTGSVEEIIQLAEKAAPKLLIADSIQTLFTDELNSSPGSVSQVRDAGAKLTDYCKGRGICLILTGHITKDGALAGPKTLEHMVDTVLYFEGNRDQELRMIRCVKNRFGSVNEVGIFQMSAAGLLEVSDPSGIFIPEAAGGGPGSCLTAALEGNRVILAEIQGLVTDSVFNNIARTIDGVEANRVLRVKAIMDKRLGIQMADKDSFINVTGGLQIREPSVDLAIAVSLASSFYDKPVRYRAVFLGELSLLGEIRRVNQAEKRTLQAARLGFTTVVLPEANKKECSKIDGVETVYAARLRDVMEIIF